VTRTRKNFSPHRFFALISHLFCARSEFVIAVIFFAKRLQSKRDAAPRTADQLSDIYNERRFQAMIA
jgi:hypothetical protein